MYIKNLIIKNFRNYKNLDISFSPEVNFIIGKNGSGKTNILEAISILSNIKSFRNISDSDIIKWDENSYFCSCNIFNNDHTIFKIGCTTNSSKYNKKIKVDDLEIKKISDYYGKFLTVIFSPNDINIINNGPDIRRKFFDSLISKINNDYINILSEFKKILSSRNKILKNFSDKKKYNLEQLDVWDKLFAEKASYIINIRLELLETFNNYFKEYYNKISDNKTILNISYYNSVKITNKNEIYKKLLDRRDRDVILGSTSVGPQRDDYIITDSKNRIFNNFASQGEKRSAAISLKISEKRIIEKETGKKVVILFDDVFSELDSIRLNKMFEFLQNNNQMIFTMVNLDLLNKKYLKNSFIFKIDDNGLLNKIDNEI